VLFARDGKRVKVKGEGQNTEPFPFPLLLFPISARSPVFTSADAVKFSLWIVVSYANANFASYLLVIFVKGKRYNQLLIKINLCLLPRLLVPVS
jgi:hypothetical protein